VTNLKLQPIALDPAVGGLLTNIKHGDAAARSVAVSQSPLAGTSAILPLGKVYGGTDPAASKAAGDAIHKIVHNASRPGAPAERESAAQQLAQLIGGEQPRQVRADALKLLGFVGGPGQVSAVAELLHVPDVREDARLALERIPDPSAEAALKNAARTVSEEYRPALDQSLRHRKMKPRDVGTKR
jgi:hypothetical protein